MRVLEMLIEQRKSIAAKIALLNEELADLDVAIEAIETRKSRSGDRVGAPHTDGEDQHRNGAADSH